MVDLLQNYPIIFIYRCKYVLLRIYFLMSLVLLSNKQGVFFVCIPIQLVILIKLPLPEKSLFIKIRPGFIRTLFLVSLFMGIRPLTAQEMLGIVNSSYSGITGSIINPAVTVTSPYYIDVNIVALDAFVENNYVYLAKEEYQFSRFFQKNPIFPTHGADSNMIAYDYYNQKDKTVYSQQRVLGPSFAVTIGRHSFGLVTGARVVMSSRNIPYEIAKFGFEQFEYIPQFDINYIDNRNIYNAELAWAEIGFNYSYVFSQKGMDYWAAGITVKDLQGYAGGYIYTKNADYVMLEHDTLIVHNLNAEAGYSSPVDFETNILEKNPLFRGKGIGLDIGVVYERKKSYSRTSRFNKLCAQSYTPYKYKIGVSLLDIGRVRFKQNAEKLVFTEVSTYWPGISSVGYTSVRELTDLLSNQFYGNPTELVQGNEIQIALPTAVSIQADLNYRNNWYINGSIVYPLQISKTGLIRPVLFAVTPRYQTAFFEASMPLSLYDWNKPRIGLSARFGFLTIGTEKLSGYFHYKDFTGIDFYLGLKFGLQKGKCRNKPDSNCGYGEYKKFTKNNGEKTK